MSILATDLTFSFAEKDESDYLFQSLSFSISNGQVVALLGPSGCGKSTLIKLISGVLAPVSGNILLHNINPRKYSNTGKIGIVTQDASLLPWKTAQENILLPLKINKQKIEHERVLHILKDFSVYDYKDKKPHELSGGMQQRVALARAVIAKPSILLLDEAFSQLDERLKFELLLKVKDYGKSSGATIIIVTHDITEAVFLAKKIIYLKSAQDLIEIPIITNDSTGNIAQLKSENFLKTVARVRDHIMSIPYEK